MQRNALMGEGGPSQQKISGGWDELRARIVLIEPVLDMWAMLGLEWAEYWPEPPLEDGDVISWRAWIALRTCKLLRLGFRSCVLNWG